MELIQNQICNRNTGITKKKDDQKSAIDDLKKLPSSVGALLMHSKNPTLQAGLRATLQAGYLQEESDTDEDIPNPEH